jgi:hypothetical protein
MSGNYRYQTDNHETARNDVGVLELSFSSICYYCNSVFYIKILVNTN